MTRVEIIKKAFDYLVFKGVIATRADFADAISYNRTNLSSAMNGNEKYLSDSLMGKIAQAFPEFDRDWLLYGEGEMLEESNKVLEVEESEAPMQEPAIMPTVPLLPISALAGSLAGFDASVTLPDCERIISPIEGADFAIEVHGDSMTPDYPSGARILIKKIDMSAFIEWGKTYVLSTVNGSIVKVVFPKGDDAVECRSINTAYPPFAVRYKDIYGMYRVLMCMTLK